MNEAELSAYCRSRGLYAEQIQQWRQACEQANDWDHTQNQRLKSARKEDKHSISTLEKELKRKEKALAEAAALLVLQKKYDPVAVDGCQNQGKQYGHCRHECLKLKQTCPGQLVLFF